MVVGSLDSVSESILLQPLDLSPMIRPVLRHHRHIVRNCDPVIEFRMASGFQQVYGFQSSQQPHIGMAVESIERDQLPLL
jgi:hypothetical protein